MATASLSDPAPPPIAPDRAHVEPRRGLRLGRYELLAPIARGGMAEVWIARQLGELGFRRLVAIKTIRPEYAENPSFRKMFLDEARLAARIHHANVVEVLDLGEEGAMVFQAMTLIEGDSLAGLLRRWHQRGEAGGLPPAIALRLVADAAAGLHAAHELTDDDGTPLKLVHRDVSPHNILVGVDGVGKIADFGIAKALGRVSDETEAGQMKGKLSYLSPEQVARRQPDRRSDVFACGVVLWETLTGARLFRGEDPVDTLEKVRSMRIPDVRELAPEVAPAIADVVTRALARDPNERFMTAAAFADAAEAAGRSASTLASSKDVAQLVSLLAGADVERRREVSRDASKSGASGSSSVDAVAMTPETHATTILDAPREPRARFARVAFIAGALGIVAAIVGSIALGRSTVPTQRAEAEPTLTPAPAPNLTQGGGFSPPAPPPTGDVPSPLSPPGVAAAHAPAHAPRPRARGAATAPPRPKFGNPYQN